MQTPLTYTARILSVEPNGCHYEIRGPISICKGFRKGSEETVSRWLKNGLNKINGRHRLTPGKNWMGSKSSIRDIS